MKPQPLSEEDLRFIRAIVDRKIRLMDALEEAVCAEDMARVLRIARELVGLEQQLKS